MLKWKSGAMKVRRESSRSQVSMQNTPLKLTQSFTSHQLVTGRNRGAENFKEVSSTVYQYKVKYRAEHQFYSLCILWHNVCAVGRSSATIKNLCIVVVGNTLFWNMLTEKWYFTACKGDDYICISTELLGINVNWLSLCLQIFIPCYI